MRSLLRRIILWALFDPSVGVATHDPIGYDVFQRENAGV